MSTVLAIVGRPNVGKSALFNRIAGRRIAIVHDQPGVTRDRVSAELEWRGRPFTLIDTGGLGLLQNEKAPDAITGAAREQVRLAIESAAAVLMVVDAQGGIAALDREVAEQLRRSGKSVLVVANKADHAGFEPQTAEFSELGFPVFPVSAVHGRGTAVLMSKAIELLPADYTREERGSEPMKLAVVGRPNVGKSSLINALVRSERVIVSPVPGTTRDAVDVPLEVETDGVRQSYLLIDTAGMRKARRVDDSIEFFGVKRAEDSIARCDLAVLVLDAEAGITEQDKKVAGMILRHEKACVLVVNKWDLVAEPVRAARAEKRRRSKGKGKTEPSKSSLADFANWVQGKMFFLDFAPVIFTSARDGFHLERLLEAVRYVAAQLQQKIPTPVLNRSLHDAVQRRQPVSSAGSRLKFFYATQVRQAPPTFMLFVNRPDLFTPAYRKYLTQSLREAFGYEGCPIVLQARARR